jgi:hypothetical protein
LRRFQSGQGEGNDQGVSSTHFVTNLDFHNALSRIVIRAIRRPAAGFRGYRSVYELPSSTMRGRLVEWARVGKEIVTATLVSMCPGLLHEFVNEPRIIDEIPLPESGGFLNQPMEPLQT